jgi:hypothetical protein
LSLFFIFSREGGKKKPNSMVLLHLPLLSKLCLEMLTFHKDVSLVLNHLFTMGGGGGREIHVDIS